MTQKYNNSTKLELQR